jgi:DNA-binding MarR family transcriptional regulator
MAAQDEAEPDDVEWLTPSQLNDWLWLMGMLTVLPSAIEAQLKREAGLNVFEYHVLATLTEAPDRRMPLSEVAALSGGSLSRLSHAVTRLETAGLVERRTCTEAGHRYEARLTPAGLQKIQEAAPGHVREARRLVVDALTPEQLATIGRAARTIVSTADPAYAATLVRRLPLGPTDDGPEAD